MTALETAFPQTAAAIIAGLRDAGIEVTPDDTPATLRDRVQARITAVVSVEPASFNRTPCTTPWRSSGSPSAP